MLFLAGDNFSSRNVFNSLCHQYLIPGFHVGVDIQPAETTGEIVEIKVETRVVMPYSGGGCLRCQGLIPAAKLQLEGLSADDRVRQGYFGAEGLRDVPEPSVMALNVLSVAPAVNDILMMFTGLFENEADMQSLRYLPLERRYFRVANSDPVPCRHCSLAKGSLYAMGDRARLPCRRSDQLKASSPNVWTWLTSLLKGSKK